METIGIIESSVWRFRFRVSLGCFFQGARGAGTRILRGGGGWFREALGDGGWHELVLKGFKGFL